MSCRHSWSVALLALLLPVTIGASASTQDWAQWRGPQRDGVVSSFQAPAAWPERLKPEWKLTVGIGHSSPVVVGRSVFVHARQDEREVVSAFDLNTGTLLWRDSYDAPYLLNPAAAAHLKGPKSTPVAANGKLYTLGITEILSCYQIATGKLVWRKTFSNEFKETSPEYGTAMSPLVESGRLIVHVGTAGEGALTALDAVTGEVKWRWTGDGPGYASPIVVTLGGTRQIVTQSQSAIVSVAADTGRMLWSLPFTTPYVQNIVTPLIYNDTIIFSGLGKGVMAIRPAKRGEAWAAEQVWQNADVSMYMNSPVLSRGLLIGFSHKNSGQYFCLDAATGKTLWKGEGRKGENAAMLTADSLVFSLGNDGDLFVTTASAAGLAPIKTYHVAESQTWAHPILVGRRLLIKDATTLALWTIE